MVCSMTKEGVSELIIDVFQQAKVYHKKAKKEKAKKKGRKKNHWFSEPCHDKIPPMIKIAEETQHVRIPDRLSLESPS